MLSRTCISLWDAIWWTAYDFNRFKKLVEVDRWQGVDVKGTPRGRMWEITDYSFQAPIPPTIDELQRQVAPNLPWAEDHFQERVSGQPLNPGEQFKNWPFFDKKWFEEKIQTEPGFKFTHTYMERYWPPRELMGIRYRYGDLNDVIDLLEREPYTRQAYLPVWFPEDTGAVHRGRVPCTLGYLFLLREGRLSITYYIRSCDFFRHFQDDIYLTARLLQYVLLKLQQRNPAFWNEVRTGYLTMHIGSLHIFEPEEGRLKRFLDNWEQRRVICIGEEDQQGSNVHADG